ncbi:tRNA pseudouridine(13) synthase TruD [Methylophaga sp.]|uniref:tRNA pseudouridine(13) synthase TruD n=1 Tax=Methylophaga sp. TaxID=2024840 RepID=UPI003F6A194F
MRQFNFSELARANISATQCKANIRQQPDHFQVNEKIPFEPQGEGGHAMLLIEKTGSNTDWIAKQLARFAGVDDVAVGYAGMKDRHAVTTQWFSVNLEGHDEPDWSAFAEDSCIVKTITRHNKKLKRGVLSGNFFHLCLSDVKGDKDTWQKNLESIQQHGVPNYFAEQRFGHHYGNLEKADRWFVENKKPKKRQQRSIFLSAARSWLFNLVLSERVKTNTWQKHIKGDVMQLAGTRSSYFEADDTDDSIASRLEQFDIHPTGPLWGRGEALTRSASLELEKGVLANWSDWQQGLERAGLKQERRALRLHPEECNWQFEEPDQLQLSFYLPAGSYATAVLRELAIVTDISQRNSDSNLPLSFNNRDDQD